MKLQINRHELGEGLSAAGIVTAVRTPKPILQCVLIEAREDCCVLKATDLELGLHYTVTQAEVLEKGAVLVSAEKLLQIVRESGEETLLIETDESQCHVRGRDSHFQIVMQNVAEFPPVPVMEGAADLEVEAKELRRLVEWTVFAAARENSRYAIHGVLWERDGGKLLLTATDGRRLSHAEGQVSGEAGPALRAIVPIRAMNLFLRVLSDTDPLVGVKISGTQVFLRSPRATVSSALVEGQFPRYQDVIPTDSDKKAELSRAEFLSAIRQAAVLTNEESKTVRLSFSSEELTLTSRAPEEGEATVKLLSAYQGEPIDIGFNPVFLVDILKVAESDRVTLEMKSSSRPGIVRSGPDLLYVVMPVNLS